MPMYHNCKKLIFQICWDVMKLLRTRNFFIKINLDDWSNVWMPPVMSFAQVVLQPLTAVNLNAFHGISKSN